VRSKSLIGIAVAGVFGWAGSAHAGSDHHSSGVAPSEGQFASAVMFDGFDGQDSDALAGGSPHSEQGMGSTSNAASGTAGGSFRMQSEAPALDSAGNEVSALESGVYPDYYIVTWSPMTSSAWDSYALPFEPTNGDMLVVLDDADYVLTTYDVILLPSDFGESSANVMITEESGG
jgi:hypothetical protein